MESDFSCSKKTFKSYVKFIKSLSTNFLNEGHPEMLAIRNFVLTLREIELNS